MSKPSPKDHPFQNDPKELGTCKVCKCLEGTHGDGKVTTPTNLSDEGLSKLTSELVDNAREVLTGIVAGETTFKKFWEPRILSLLQQVRDAAKKEEREACAKVAESTKITEEVVCTYEDGRKCFAHQQVHLRWCEIATAIRALEGI